MRVLKDVFGANLCGADIIENKRALIIDGEVEISQRVLNKGYSICCSAFPNFIYNKNSSWDIPLGGWRRKEEFKGYANTI